MRIIPQFSKRRRPDKRAGDRRDQRGYSLLEILVVLAIMAVLATLVAPRLFNQVDRSKITTAKAQARSLKISLDAMRLDMGRYPTAEEGLLLLVAPPNDAATRASWFGPYVDGELPSDPWGNAYRYFPPQTDESGLTRGPRIVTYGADNAEGGEGLDQDIEI